MTERVYGNKYDKDLDIAEIAKLVRADLKAAMAKGGSIPAGSKFKVRIQRYSGGQSLSVTIMSITGVKFVNAARARFEIENPHTYYNNHDLRVHTNEAEAVSATVAAIVSAYNHDGSDTMTDHFDVNFYAHIDFDWKVCAIERDEIRAALLIDQSFHRAHTPA